MQTKSARVKDGSEIAPPPEKFGDLVTADHLICLGANQGNNGEEFAVVIKDVACNWLSIYPTAGKTGEEAQAAL